MWTAGHDQKGGLSGAGVQKPTTFLASSCNEITVSGAGYEKTNGIYTRSTADCNTACKPQCFTQQSSFACNIKETPCFKMGLNDKSMV